MPRISAERRATRRGGIIAAARRCFSRNGFHETSMSDIAAEAGVSVGTPYRYFASKEEVVLEVAGEAFHLIFEPLVRIAGSGTPVGPADLVDLAIKPVADRGATGGDNGTAVDELLRCGVLAWAELLRHDDLRAEAQRGLEEVHRAVAAALRAGQAGGAVPEALDPDRGARVVIALLHGFVLQRTAFDLRDVAGFARDARTLLTDSGVLRSGA